MIGTNLKRAAAAVLLAAAPFAAYAQQQVKEVMVCAAHWSTLEKGVLEYAPVVMECNYPTKRERTTLNQIYSQGWRLTQTFKRSSASRDPNYELFVFVFER